jgi:hypothetical protein
VSFEIRVASTNIAKTRKWLEDDVATVTMWHILLGSLSIHITWIMYETHVVRSEKWRNVGDHRIDRGDSNLCITAS